MVLNDVLNNFSGGLVQLQSKHVKNSSFDAVTMVTPGDKKRLVNFEQENRKGNDIKAGYGYTDMDLMDAEDLTRSFPAWSFKTP